jgi:hypothetical protein
MNYKIRITAENQAIVKRIADENGMNKREFRFNNFFQYYTISNNLFDETLDKSDYPELTTEQFIELFDKKETELDKWLKETKAKNLSFHDLEHLIFELQNPLFSNLEGSNFTEKAEFLYNQWNNPTKPHICKYCQAETTQDDETCYAKPTEWQPKRGDRVLVWNNNEEMAREAIYFDTDKFVICFWDEKEFENYSNSNCFRLGNYCHMKPLPIERFCGFAFGFLPYPNVQFYHNV